MNTVNDTPNQIHHGRNVKRFREMFGIKQEALAELLGDDWSQKKVSVLEAKEIIEPELLEQVAKVLKVPADAIRNFNEDTAINIISNTFNNHDHATPQFANIINHTPSFNPVDKVVDLYEALLKSEREKIALLEKLLAEKGKI